MKRLAAALVLAGCVQAGGEPHAAFLPDDGGLAVGESGMRVDFGRAPEGVIAALTREMGAGRDIGLAGCPAEITRQIGWGGLVLSFTEERFAGWRSAGANAGTVCAS